jgi:hypothetical protein
MADPLREQALARIERVERRLIALQESGISCAALISQLSFARDLVAQRQYEEVEVLCDELAAAAGELARGVADASGLARAVRKQQPGRLYEQEALSEQIRDVLEAGLLDKVMKKRGARGGGSSTSRPAVVATSMGDLVEHIGQAVATVLERSQARQGDTRRLKAVIKEVIGEPGGPSTARLERLLEQVVQRHQQQMEQDLLSSLEGLRAGLEELRQQVDVARQEADLDPMTDRIQRAVEQALADQLPTDNFHLTDRVQQAVSEQVSHNDDHLSTRIKQAVSEGLARHQVVEQTPLSEVVEETIERARQEIPGFDASRFGEQLRGLLGEQLAQVEEHLQAAFNRSLGSRSGQLEDRLANLIERIGQIPLLDGAGPELQEEVRQQVEQAIDSTGLRSTANDQEMIPVRGQLRAVLAGGLQPLPAEPAVFEISPTELQRCDNPKHLVNASVADAIEDMIDGMLGSVGRRMTKRFTNHITRRILNSGRSQDAGLDGAAGSGEESAMSGRAGDLEPARGETRDEYAPTAEEDDSVLTCSLRSEDLSSALDDATTITPVIQIPVVPAASAPAVQSEEDAMGDNADDDDASAMIEALLRDLGSGEQMEGDLKPPTTRQKPAKALARDLLYELTEASMPESARQVRDRADEREGTSSHEFSPMAGGGETSELIRDALQRGEARFTKPYAPPAAGGQPITDFPAAKAAVGKRAITQAPPVRGSGSYELHDAARREPGVAARPSSAMRCEA